MLQNFITSSLPCSRAPGGFSEFPNRGPRYQAEDPVCLKGDRHSIILVQGMFLHAVDTGLQDEAIQTRLRPFFQNPDVQDEVLIQQINEIVLEETERK